jgi:proteasome lid subunit RPN8/RPN11
VKPQKSSTVTPREAARPATGPDVSELKDASFPAVPFPGGRQQAFRIFFSPEVHARIWTHARENLAVEVCGVLVGSWGKDEAGPFVAISEAIRGEAATSKFAEVTFTHETWARINQEMDSRFSHLSIVGWYHTHPNFGVFLSDRDVFIQQHFFSGAGQIAHVVDPVRGNEGVFVWHHGKPLPAAHYWVGDRLIASEPSTHASKTDGAADAAGGEQAAEPKFAWLLPVATQVLACAALFLLGFLLAGRLSDGERDLLAHNAMSRACLLLGVKPGLRERLDACIAELERTSQQLAENPPADETPEARRQRLDNLRASFVDTRARLRRLQDDYCLTPAETEQMVRDLAVLLRVNSEGLGPRERAEINQRLEDLLIKVNRQGLLEQAGGERAAEPGAATGKSPVSTAKGPGPAAKEGKPASGPPR